MQKTLPAEKCGAVQVLEEAKATVGAGLPAAVARSPAEQRFDQLMQLEVRPGSWQVELCAGWTNETSRGHMSPLASTFWATDGRKDLLQEGREVEDALENWDEDEHGPMPEPGAPELDIDLFADDRDRVMQDVQLALPTTMFAADSVAASLTTEWWWSDGGRKEGCAIVVPLRDLVSWFSSTYEAAVAAAKQRLALAAGSRTAGSVINTWLSPDLVEHIGRVAQLTVPKSASGFTNQLTWLSGTAVPSAGGSELRDWNRSISFPAPQPCTFEYTLGWKNSSTSSEITTEQPTQLGEMLRQQLVTDVEWVRDGGRAELFCTELEIGTLECWEDHWSKHEDMVITPPRARAGQQTVALWKAAKAGNEAEVGRLLAAGADKDEVRAATRPRRLTWLQVHSRGNGCHRPFALVQG